MTQSKDPTAARALKRFEAFVVGNAEVVDDVHVYGRGRPYVLLPTIIPIALPEFYSHEKKRFESWVIEKLDERGALAWSFWLTATAEASRIAPELLPYIAQLRPTRGWRLGRVFRPGIVTL